MTDISTNTAIARESAREVSGQFGEQQHSAPEATLAPAQEASAVASARADLATRRAEVAALRSQLATSEAAMRSAEDVVLRAVVQERYPDASFLTTWNSHFEPVTAYDATGTKIGPDSKDSHHDLYVAIHEALDADLPDQDLPAFMMNPRQVKHDLDGVTPGKGPWVMISTAKDAVPVISDHVEFPFDPSERHEWREATSAEIERYETYWEAQDD